MAGRLKNGSPLDRGFKAKMRVFEAPKEERKTKPLRKRRNIRKMSGK